MGKSEIGQRVKYVGPLDDFKGMSGLVVDANDGRLLIRWDGGAGVTWHDLSALLPVGWEDAKPATEAAKPDPVNRPQHYQFFPDLEAIEVIARSTTQEQFYGYCLGNRLKYRLRAGNKDKLEQDIAKSDKYLELYEKYKGLCYA